MTTTKPLRWTKTETGRYSALGGGFRYIARRVAGSTTWELTIQRTMIFIDVEIADPAHRAEWYEMENLREAKLLAAEFHALGDEPRGLRSRFSIAIERTFDKLIAAL